MSQQFSPAEHIFLDEERAIFNDGRLDLGALAKASRWLKAGVFFAITALTFLVVWWLWVSASLQDLERAATEETHLKALASEKLLQLSKLEPLAQQRRQTLTAITSAELALSRQSEMASLLKAINRLGLAQSLQFELFRPEKERIHAHFAELPISLRVAGRYHSLGGFAADIASLPQLVTLDSLSLLPSKDGHLVMEATVHAYRHLQAGDRPSVKTSSTQLSDSP